MKNRQKIIDDFLKSLERTNRSSLTIKRHSDNLRYFFNYNRRRKLIRRNVERFIDYYKKGHKPATVNSAIITLKLFTRFLFERRKIKREIHFHLKTLQDNPSIQVPLTPKQIRQIIYCPREWDGCHRYMDRRRYDFFFMLVAWLGLRRFEALNIKIGHLDFERGLLLVLGKGNIPRGLAIPNKMVISLESWVKERKLTAEDYLFQNKSGQRPSPATFSDELKKRLKILGFDKSIHLHSFRHAWASENVRANKNTAKLMKVLGHTNMKTFLRYVQLNGEDLRDVIDDNPIITYKDNQKLPDKPNLPKYLADDDFRVN